MTHILVFGDSIAQGYWDKNGGWVARLRKFIDAKGIGRGEYDCLVFNLGVSGDTTEGLLQRLEFETRQRTRFKEETTFIFAIGMNDALLTKENALLVAPKKVENNIQKIIDLAEKFSKKIVFVGLTPVDEGKTNPLPWAPQFSVKNENIKKYDEIIKKVCKKNKILFVELFDNWSKINYNGLLEDGQHPNSRGHEKIFETVKDFLIENKIIGL
jgi:lysophospholipase L1-like esterase